MDDDVTEQTSSGPVSLTVRIGFHFGSAIHSTNGTYVSQDGQQSFLRREEMPLGESGEISLGRAFKEQPQDIVRFETDF
jgi:hypothetical protein